jgi:hypothetical protein
VVFLRSQDVNLEAGSHGPLFDGENLGCFAMEKDPFMDDLQIYP